MFYIFVIIVVEIEKGLCGLYCCGGVEWVLWLNVWLDWLVEIFFDCIFLLDVVVVWYFGKLEDVVFVVG